MKDELLKEKIIHLIKTLDPKLQNENSESTPLLINQTSKKEEDSSETTSSVIVNKFQAYLNEFIGVFFIALSVILSSI